MKKLLGFLILIITFGCDKANRSATGGHDIVDDFASIGMYGSLFIAVVCAIGWYLNKSSKVSSDVGKARGFKIAFWIFLAVAAVALILIKTGNS